MSKKTQKKRFKFMPPYVPPDKYDKNTFNPNKFYPIAMKAGMVNDVTFYDLSHLYKHAFEKLGWMILAKKRGMVKKMELYKHSLDTLKHDIELKLNKIQDPDHKADLKIMLDNLNILIEHAKMDL
jgi:hypothetical protein